LEKIVGRLNNEGCNPNKVIRLANFLATRITNIAVLVYLGNWNILKDMAGPSSTVEGLLTLAYARDKAEDIVDFDEDIINLMIAQFPQTKRNQIVQEILNSKPN
jgi:hypothetical protein